MLARVLRELAQIRGRHRGMSDGDEGHLGGAGDGGEIAQRVVARIAVEVRIDHERTLMREGEGVAVGRGFGAGRGADVALRTGAVVDDHLLAPLLAELGRQNAGQRVRAAAGRERHDEAHGLLGEPVLRVHRGRADEDRGEDRFHGPTTVIAPSILSVTPAMLRASSEARNTAAAATSSAAARRLSGVRERRFSHPAASITLFAPGVDTGPGASALTRMPCGASSTACWRVNVSIAPLIEE